MVWRASAALAFSGAAVPVTMAAGGTLETAATVAIPFALLFVTTTLAVRGVILSVRGGGNPRAAAATRTATVALSTGAAARSVRDLGRLFEIRQLRSR